MQSVEMLGVKEHLPIRMEVALKSLTMCLCLGEIHFSCFFFVSLFILSLPFNLLFVGGLIFRIVETCGVRVYHCVYACVCFELSRWVCKRRFQFVHAFSIVIGVTM